MTDEEICLKYDNYLGYPNDSNRDEIILQLRDRLSSYSTIEMDLVKKYNMYCLTNKVEDFYSDKVTSDDMRQQCTALKYGKTLQYVRNNPKGNHSEFIEQIKKILSTLFSE